MLKDVDPSLAKCIDELYITFKEIHPDLTKKEVSAMIPIMIRFNIKTNGIMIVTKHVWGRPSSKKPEEDGMFYLPELGI